MDVRMPAGRNTLHETPVARGRRMLRKAGRMLLRFTRGLAAGAVRAGGRIWDSGGTNLSATLAFYAMLSVYPLMLLVIALIGRFAEFPASVDQFLSTLSEVAPDYVVETVRAPLQQIVTSRGGAGAIFGVGVVLMIWAASGYVGAFGWSANQVGGVRERRPYVGRLLLRMGVALLVAVVLMLALAAAALTEAAADWLGRQLGSLGGTLDVWSTVRWPLFFLTATLLIGILFSVGPYHERFRLREVAPGVLLGVALWGLASWGFGLYLRLFAHYSYIYGTIATVVVFLLWLWLFNLALLYGVAVNAEIRDWRTGRVRGGRTGPEGSAAPRWPGSVAPVPLLEPSADEPPIVGRDDDSASRPVD